MPRPVSEGPTTAMSDDERRRANLRLGLILATVAIAVAVGFVVRVAWFGR